MQHAPTPSEDFETWELHAIEKVVAKFLSTRKLPDHIEPDLVQESAAHWVQHRGAYNPDAGALKRTFLDRVITRHLISLERGWKAAMRGGGKQPLSLDQPVSREPGASTLGDLLESHPESSSDLHIDLERAYRRLSPRHLRILKGIREDQTRQAIADLLGIHRDTLNEDLKIIRSILEDEGLREYLS